MFSGFPLTDFRLTKLAPHWLLINASTVTKIGHAILRISYEINIDILLSLLKIFILIPLITFTNAEMNVYFSAHMIIMQPSINKYFT
jgi:hypothetical protein